MPFLFPLSFVISTNTWKTPIYITSKYLIAVESFNGNEDFIDGLDWDEAEGLE